MLTIHALAESGFGIIEGSGLDHNQARFSTYRPMEGQQVQLDHIKGINKCVKCGESKPVEEFPVRSSASRRERVCLSCLSAPTKTCRRCRTKKADGEFPKHEGTLTGLSRVCVECTSSVARPVWHTDGDTIVCRSCKEEKPRKEFYRRGDANDSWLTTQCAACSIDRELRIKEFDAVGPRVIVEAKECPSCKTTKPIAKFHVQRERPDGHSRKCIECFQKRREELAASRSCLDNRHWHMTRSYGITLAQFNQMIADQHSRCAICQELLDLHENSKLRFNVDHDHRTSKVRQILCHSCNTMLGAVEHPGFLPRALEYLKKHGVDPMQDRQDRPKEGPAINRQRKSRRKAIVAEQSKLWVQ